MNMETAPKEGDPLIKPSSEEHPLYEPIVEACRTVHDPEIPVNIYDLGLIYSIRVNADSHVDIDMSLTAPGCPVAEFMPGWVAEAVEPLPGVKTVNVEIVWEPPWGMERLSDEARLELGMI
ncbi:MAG: SUF system Fe-S cluster assembly protein [Pseudomonadota bacterium]